MINSGFRTVVPRRCIRRRRGGYMYLAVMVVCVLVGLVGLSGSSAARQFLRSAQSSNESGNAAHLADAAISLGLAVLAETPDWRTSLANNVDYPSTPVPMNGGTLTWRIVDSDGSLSDDNTDTVRLYGIGRRGSNTAVRSMLLYPTDSAVTGLSSAFHCGSSVTLQYGTVWQTDHVVGVNGNLSAPLSTTWVEGNAAGSGTVSGNIYGVATSGAPVRSMPGSSVFDYWRAAGTWIPVSRLRIGTQAPLLRRAVLSPGSNPWGSTNPEGIYVIDCEGLVLTIEDLRIEGTLVVLNPGSGSLIRGKILWAPAVANYPALLVSGSIRWEVTSEVLKEIDFGVNFNPASTPYAGASDTDMSDSYPSEVTGIVYVSGQWNMNSSTAFSKFYGSALCGSCNAQCDARWSYRSVFATYPPPGFAGGSRMKMVPGSWTHSALP